MPDSLQRTALLFLCQLLKMTLQHTHKVVIQEASQPHAVSSAKSFRLWSNQIYKDLDQSKPLIVQPTDWGSAGPSNQDHMICMMQTANYTFDQAPLLRDSNRFKPHEP